MCYARAQMTNVRYISITAAAYAATFVIVSLILRSWPPYPAYVTALMMIGGAIVFAWAGTGRIQQIVGADPSEFTAASIFHAMLVTILIGGAVYIRLGPGL
ncbi:hypothetical protein C8J25_101722 [Sphingomonas faeni]|uniref:Uncharacterized protein n=1 Tax=Sphingomonas faeni TaxID=185950 RepID=A0A2T5UCG2_9SPHN|nr:hypothetical protein C8J25_101722 [Sphingomonas faeni]